MFVCKHVDFELIFMFVWNIDASMLVGNCIINSHGGINIFVEIDYIHVETYVPDIIILITL